MPHPSPAVRRQAVRTECRIGGALKAAVQALTVVAQALLHRRVVSKPVRFREIRFRLGFECECGRKVDLHPGHPQHMCGCEVVYTFDSVAGAAMQHLRQVETLVGLVTAAPGAEPATEVAA